MLVRKNKKPVSPLAKYYVTQSGRFEIPVFDAETIPEVSDEIIKKISDDYALVLCSPDDNWSGDDLYVLMNIKADSTGMRGLQNSTVDKLRPIKEELGLDTCSGFSDDRYFEDDNVRMYIDRVLSMGLHDGDWYVVLVHKNGIFKFVELRELGY